MSKDVVLPAGENSTIAHMKCWTFEKKEQINTCGKGSYLTLIIGTYRFSYDPGDFFF